jgi:hypothetical protein
MRFRPITFPFRINSTPFVLLVRTATAGASVGAGNFEPAVAAKMLRQSRGPFMIFVWTVRTTASVGAADF